MVIGMTFVRYECLVLLVIAYRSLGDEWELNNCASTCLIFLRESFFVNVVAFLLNQIG
jgi:hypothetical protein